MGLYLYENMSLLKTCGFNELYLNDDTNIMQSMKN